MGGGVACLFLSPHFTKGGQARGAGLGLDSSSLKFNVSEEYLEVYKTLGML